HASYTLVIESQYAGYSTTEQVVQVAGGGQTVDLAVPVEHCQAAPGYTFAAQIGVLGDDGQKLHDFLAERGIPSSEYTWGAEVDDYDTIIVN
ncbi:hypothetical protein, partial [Escherichia coli]